MDIWKQMEWSGRQMWWSALGLRGTNLGKRCLAHLHALFAWLHTIPYSYRTNEEWWKSSGYVFCHICSLGTSVLYLFSLLFLGMTQKWGLSKGLQSRPSVLTFLIEPSETFISFISYVIYTQLTSRPWNIAFHINNYILFLLLLVLDDSSHNYSQTESLIWFCFPFRQYLQDIIRPGYCADL